MKRKSLWFAVIGVAFAAAFMLASIVSADEFGWGDEPIMTVTGKIVKIQKIKNDLQMRIKADEGGSWVVFMGPKWFIEQQKLKFAAGDKVQVKGKKFKDESIIASEISKGDWMMKLRNDEDGQPIWMCCFPSKEGKN
jgi:hypothetical protein